MSMVLAVVVGVAHAGSAATTSADEVERRVRAQRGVTVLHVWASWCGSCKAAFAPLNELAAEDRARGLEVVAVSIDEDRGRLERYLDGRATYWTGLHHRGPKAELAASVAELGGRWDGSIPYQLVVDGSGRVLDEWTGTWKDPEVVKRKVRRHLPDAPTSGVVTLSASDLAGIDQGPVHIVLAGREGEPVFVDGWEAGVLPLDTELIAGEHSFRVGDGEPVQRVVQFDGTTTTIDLAPTD